MSATSSSGMPTARAPARVTSPRSFVVTLFSRATFRRSRVKAGAEVVTSSATSVGRPPDFDEGLPEMDQMALGLQLARPPQILRSNRGRREGIVTVHQFVGADDLPVLERKGVERPQELLRTA